MIQPRQFQSFRCIGAECEETCCQGWDVTVDRASYEKYQQCQDPELKPSLERLVTIANPEDRDNFARITLTDAACPFLAGNLCSIQIRLGEAYLPATCGSFPRVMNVVDGTGECSLDLSCPEAARLMLLRPGPDEFCEEGASEPEVHWSRTSRTDTAPGRETHPKPYEYFHEIRGFVIGLLQYRALPLWKRILIIGFFCDKLQQLASGPDRHEIPEMIRGYVDGVHAGMFDEVSSQLPSQPGVQLEVALELIVSRISSGYTSAGFLSCYGEFMKGLHWTSQSTMEELARDYNLAYERYYEPLLRAHPYILEHYLVNYVYKNMFPLGPLGSSSRLCVQSTARSIHAAFTLMAVFYALIRTVMVGVAGFYRESFGDSHIIKVIYSFTRNFEHNLVFPDRMIQALSEKGLDNPRGTAILVKN